MRDFSIRLLELPEFVACFIKGYFSLYRLRLQWYYYSDQTD